MYRQISELQSQHHAKNACYLNLWLKYLACCVVMCGSTFDILQVVFANFNAVVTFVGKLLTVFSLITIFFLKI